MTSLFVIPCICIISLTTLLVNRFLYFPKTTLQSCYISTENRFSSLSSDIMQKYFRNLSLMVGELLVDYLLADAENFQSSKHSWAISSGGEHYLDTVGVTSSNLVSPTMNSKEPSICEGSFCCSGPEASLVKVTRKSANARTIWEMTAKAGSAGASGAVW